MRDKLRCFIMRGLPGSGKSFHVQKLQKFYPTAVVCSADDHFKTPDGGFEYKPGEICIAHQTCQSKAFNCFSQGFSPVIIDNTSCSTWEYVNYIQQARFFGYQVSIVDLTPKDRDQALKMLERNSHGVPLEVGLKMLERLEPTVQLDGVIVLHPDTGL